MDDKEKLCGQIITELPSDDEDYRNYLDANYETCQLCGVHLLDEEIHTHDCGIEPKLENSFNKQN